MTQNPSELSANSPPSQPISPSQKGTLKLPRLVFDGYDVLDANVRDSIFAFPPNRDTLGGTAYLIIEPEGNILVDCPAWDDTNQQFLQKTGVRWLVVTHRGGLGKVREIQQALGCEVIIQEQEAYLLPNLKVSPFHQECTISSSYPPGGASHRLIWTAGHSPGSSCLYYPSGGILFTGRHLLPDRAGSPVPLRTAKTFHWPRQIRNVQKLLDQFTPDTLKFICPGASLGFLRGKQTIDDAYKKLAQLDLAASLNTQPLL
jgi:glyoxylase-like metal-dependent hydrolase (beta-lactamase superfamily II)